MVMSLGVLAALVLSLSVKAQDSNNTTVRSYCEVDIDQLMSLAEREGLICSPRCNAFTEKTKKRSTAFQPVAQF
jgi:hypothetical protein